MDKKNKKENFANNEQTLGFIMTSIPEEGQEVLEMVSREEAEKLTQDIKSTSTALYILLKKAHDTKAWIAMGYNSWKDYIDSEFAFSRTRSYQLINQAKVIEEINEINNTDLYITEKDARAIKSRLPEITKKIEETVGKAGDLPISVVEDKTREVIEAELESQEDKGGTSNISRAPKDFDDESQTVTDSTSEMREWRPEGIDMDKMKNMLSDEDKMFFNNLKLTMGIFEDMPPASEFGKRIKNSSENKTELIALASNAFSWIAMLLEEIE